MTDFTSDDDYESFDLRGRTPVGGAPASDARVTAKPADPVDVDDDDLEDDFDDDDDDDDLEDATDEDIDLVIAIHREDGQPVGTALTKDLANDLDELIAQLRRLPADAGALGMVSLADEVFVLCRVRGANVQALLSDAAAANDWPIARDVADFLGEDIPDPDDDDTGAMGDLGILVDVGVSEFEMESLCDDLDSDTDELLATIADRMAAGTAFRRALDAFDD
ncbi:tRNA adenosine deaminase-associated protein [Mariniluteicoccus flavus]